jgi:hypothetical protein
MYVVNKEKINNPYRLIKGEMQGANRHAVKWRRSCGVRPIKSD